MIDSVLSLLRQFEPRMLNVGYGGIALSSDPQADTESFRTLIELDEISDYLVIATDTLCGDPIFVDLRDDDYPVYFVAHDLDNAPRQIADTLKTFLRMLTRLATLTEGRSTPVEMERRPLTGDEIDEFLTTFKDENVVSDETYWRRLLDRE